MSFQLVMEVKHMKRLDKTFDEEFAQVAVSYTTGGLTVSASKTEAENATTSGNEESMWSLGLSFAF